MCEDNQGYRNDDFKGRTPTSSDDDWDGELEPFEEDTEVSDEQSAEEDS